jgi:phage tail sheath protein FI
VAGSDYTLDRAYGIIKRLKNGNLPPKAELSVSYEYGDPTQVTSADIIGGINDAEIRHGMEALIDSDTLFGFRPGRIIAPVYATQLSVQNALVAIADKLRAIAYLDVPVGVSVSQVLAGRGEDGDINLGISSARAVWCYPHVKVIDPRTEEEVLRPSSQYQAALASNVEATEGYWFSSGNHELSGITGLETPVQFAIDDPNCEAAMLHDAGILTIVRPYGRGFTAWGNRSSAWPGESHPISFINIRVIADKIREITLQILQPYMAKPLTNAMLNSACARVQAALDVEKGKGALTGGKFEWSEADNPVGERALGNAVFQLSFMGPPPFTKGWVKMAIDTKWLQEVNS